MRIDHSGHQRRPHSIDHRRATVRGIGGAEPRGTACHLFDAISLDDDLARVGIFTGCVEDPHIGEMDWVS